MSSTCLVFRLKYPTRMLKEPSLFLYQPSSAPVTLAPDSFRGSRGSCAGACPKRANAHVTAIIRTLKPTIAERNERILSLTPIADPRRPIHLPSSWRLQPDNPRRSYM